MKPVNIILIWNYSQAYLKDQANNYILPVIRHYLQRDYIDMIKISQKYPKLKLTFNIPPILIEQLADYVNHSADDYNWRLSQKKANDLNRSEKKFILKHFFKGIDDVVIHPYSRYSELYEKKKNIDKNDTLNSSLEYFSNDDFRDLQVWHNLAWIGKESQRAFPIKKLIQKGKNFSENDKIKLFNHLLKLQESLFRLYESSISQKRIEISTNPYYNPIVPLALDSHKIHLKETETLPLKQFTGYPLIIKQILFARRFAKRIFRQASLGIQAASGMLNNETLNIFARTRFSWTVLEKHHIGSNLQIEDSTQIYKYSSNNKHEINCFINQNDLAQKIERVYPSMKANDAVDDFFNSLFHIQRNLRKGTYKHDPVITIAVNGSMLWDNFKEGACEFLNLLYNRLEMNSDFETILPRDYLDKQIVVTSINKITEKSKQINYGRWIGSPSTNRAWDQLTKLYEFYLQKEKEGELSERKLREARRQIQIALNADWFSWYSDQNSLWDIYYDELFRALLIKAYELLYAKVPKLLFYNLKSNSLNPFEKTNAIPFIYPKLTGKYTYSKEWDRACLFDINKYQIETQNPLYQFIKTISIAYNEKHLCFRIAFESFPQIISHFQIDFHSPAQSSYCFFPLIDECRCYEQSPSKASEWRQKESKARFACDELWECFVPVTEVNLTENNYFTIQFLLYEKDSCIERFPKSNVIRMIYRN